jgi:hypothetical protein
MATVLLTACGDDSGSSGGSGSTDAAAAEQTTAPIPRTLEGQLAQTFPKPEAGANSLPGAAAAIEAGRKACAGKTPVEVREEFIAAAEAEAGLQDGQKQMVAELETYEKQASSNFAAGQLGAGVYEATLPEKQRMAGYQGCVYELALQLRRELAQQKSSKKSQPGG